MKSALLLAVDGATGMYKLMLYNRQGYTIGGPIAQGNFPAANKRYTFLGDDLILMFDDKTANYEVLRADKSTYMSSLALPMTQIGSGNLHHSAECSNFTT